jgi:hypothetical protein
MSSVRSDVQIENGPADQSRQRDPADELGRHFCGFKSRRENFWHSLVPGANRLINRAIVPAENLPENRIEGTIVLDFRRC